MHKIGFIDIVGLRACQHVSLPVESFIRAHATLCFMALIPYRIMRGRLREAKTGLSPERVLAQLRRIYQHQITVDHHPLSGGSTITKEQAHVLRALRLPRPVLPQQLALL